MVTFDLSGTVFVITGGARGMGAATAELAAASGASVMIADILDDEAEAVVARIRDRSGTASYRHCDLTDAAAIESLMAEAEAVYGGIDVLHNNAAVTDIAVAGPGPTVEALTAEQWDLVIAVNLRAPFLCAKSALPYLKRSSYPSIVNVGSTGGSVARPGMLAYGPSKAGIAQLTRTLAFELAPHRVRVNAYAPGFVETALATATIAAAPDPVERRRALLEGYLAPDPADPSEIAALVCYLASREASFINGAVLPIDGGFTAWKASPGELGRGART
jgi:NAD(P)-dependent dehydrogenase (short-subunit alcohol dehydrogenase family)